VKLISWYKEETCEKFCAEIKCLKDNYKVLNKAWASPINESIEKMIGTGKIAMGAGYDGQIIVDWEDLTILNAGIDTAIDENAFLQIKGRLPNLANANFL